MYQSENVNTGTAGSKDVSPTPGSRQDSRQGSCQDSRQESRKESEGIVPLESRGPGRSLVDYANPSKIRDREKIDPTVRAAIRELALGQSRWPLLLFGPPGSGKTCAALCALDVFGGMYVTASELCDLLIRAEQRELTFSMGHRRSAVDIWGAWRGAPLAILDEIGIRGRQSDFHQETIKAAIDQREGRPLIVISHGSLARVEDVYPVLGKALASRLGQGQVVETYGDRRLNLRGSRG